MRMAISVVLGLAIGALAFTGEGPSVSEASLPAPIYRTQPNAKSAARERLLARRRSHSHRHAQAVGR